MDFQAALHSFMDLHHRYGGMLDSWLLVFSRMLGFTVAAPIINRRDIPFIIKLSLAIFLTCALVWTLPPTQGDLPSFQKDFSGAFLLLVMINAFVGAFLGFLGDLILRSVYAAGSMMNNQIGLSSAMVMDPSTRTQVMLLETLFGFIGTVVFAHLGGFYWLILALQRSFEVLPLYTIRQPLTTVVDLSYLTTLSSNLLLYGSQLVAPVLIITLSVDIMLGVVNRTAQQMPVFQLSFALKPAIGVAIMLSTLPILLNAMANYLSDYSRIF